MKDSRPVFGVAHFQDIQSFVTSPLDLEAMLADLLDEQVTAYRVTDWPKVTECIKRGSVFALTTVSPAFHASLRFDSANFESGGYNIVYTARRPSEHGYAETVTVITDAHAMKHRFAKLRSFPHRFAVVTTASNRGHTRMLWLIGLTHWHVVPDS